MSFLFAVHPDRRADSNLELQHGSRGDSVVGVRHESGIKTANSRDTRLRKGGLGDGMVHGLEIELHNVSDGGVDAAGCVDKTCGSTDGHHVCLSCSHGWVVVVFGCTATAIVGGDDDDLGAGADL